MINLIFTPILIGCFLALVAFLQMNAQWWKGLGVVVALVIAGYTIALFDNQLESDSPAIFISGSLWICATLISLGSMTALIFRGKISNRSLVRLAFVAGWAMGISIFLISRLP